MPVTLKQAVFSDSIVTFRSNIIRYKDARDPPSNTGPNGEWREPVYGNTLPYGIPEIDAWIAGRGFSGYLVQQADVWGSPRYLSSTPGVVYRETSGRPLKYLEVINSSNTPDWPEPKGLRVAGFRLTKPKLAIKRPTKPVYIKPRLLSVAEPLKPVPVVLSIMPPAPFRGEGLVAHQLRLERWSAAKRRRETRLYANKLRSYEQKLLRYDARVRVNAERTSAADRLHQRRLAKYVEQLRRYEIAVKKSQTPSLARASASTKAFLPDNPYGRIKMAMLAPVNRYRVSLGFHPDVPGYLAHTWPLVWYEYEVITNSSTPEKLAQYGEQTRRLILALLEPALEEMDKKLKRKIHSKLKAQVLHVGNLIAERTQTFELVKDTAQRILKLIKLKKNIFKTAAAYARDPNKVASDVLAFKFGVEPLMQDIMAFAQYIDESSDSPTVVVRTNKTLSNVVLLGNGVQFRGSVEMSYTVKCVVDNPAARSLSQFGLINPLEIAWEVFPWSFIVDWFFPVGEWISSQTADCGLLFQTGTKKVKLVGHFDVTDDGTNQNGLNPGMANVMHGTPNLWGSFIGEVQDRTVLTKLPDVPLPPVKNPWSWSHGIEAVALAVQRLKKSAPTQRQ